MRNWLSDRVATLYFDGTAVTPTAVQAGVPQESPLSSVLFILYITSLYQQLKEVHPHLAIVGFADDTNLLTFGRDPETNVRQLEAAWKIYLQWADTRVMAFGPEKSELVHFNRGRKRWTNRLELARPEGAATSVRPTESARFLGVWLD